MNKIQIFIKPMINVNGVNGMNANNYCHSQFVVTISDNELIDNLRHEIYAKCSIAPNRQILRFNNKTLMSGTRVNEYYNLNNNSTIIVYYNNEKEWFSKEKDNIENGIIKLTENIDNLKSEQLKINNLTNNLCNRIKTAPTLKQLNLCKIEDSNDINMSQLNNLIINFKNKVSNNNNNNNCINCCNGRNYGNIKQNIDQSMNNLSILINNAQVSLNYEKELQCTQINKKMSKIEFQIKMLESQLTDLETSKATILSKFDQQKKDLSMLSNKHITNNKYEIKQIINNVNMNTIINNLKDNKSKRFKELESKNQSFDTENLIIWIKNINNGYFNNKNGKYDQFFNTLEKQCIDGENLQELSSNICLTLLGLSCEKDQNILIQHINNLLRMNMNNDFIVKGNRCCACLSKCIQCVLCPCGHQPYCYDCANKSRKHDNRCPICRTQITNVMKTFIAGV